jgi:hypothetical protein
MITFSNVQTYKDLPFDQYLQLPGYSHSWLKSERNGHAMPFTPSAKVYFGSLVDDLLTDPSSADVSHPDFNEALEAANNIRNFCGQHFFDAAEKQISFTATMHWGQFSMPVKGRIDFMSTYIFDVKVTNEPEEKLNDLIYFMGYPNQMFLYAKALGFNKAVLVFYIRRKKKVVLKPINLLDSNKFFENKIIKFGI